jgi:hypothetical protein
MSTKPALKRELGLRDLTLFAIIRRIYFRCNYCVTLPGSKLDHGWDEHGNATLRYRSRY